MCADRYWGQLCEALYNCAKTLCSSRWDLHFYCSNTMVLDLIAASQRVFRGNSCALIIVGFDPAYYFIGTLFCPICSGTIHFIHSRWRCSVLYE